MSFKAQLAGCAVLLAAALFPLTQTQAEMIFGSDASPIVVRADGLLKFVQAGDPRAAVRAGNVLPLAQVLSSISAQYPGELLDARLEGSNPPVYVMKILMGNGRVVLVQANAQTGQIVSVR